MFQTIKFIPFATIIFFLIGCTTTSSINTQKTQYRPIYALPVEVAADTITVARFRSVCDMLARNLVVQAFITRSYNPPVITIRKLQNKTGIEIDEHIFQETIRAKLMEYSQGAVLFRDDESYKDILQERIRQSSEEVTITMSDSVVETKTYDRIKEREYDSGSLSAGSGSFEKTKNIEEESEMEMSQTGTVKSRVAAVDYFLRGIIYQVKERNVNKPESGMNYFQYQFRVVDARSGLIVWEKMLDSKMAGKYTVPTAAAGQQPGAAAQGQTTPGFPSGNMQIPGQQSSQQQGGQPIQQQGNQTPSQQSIQPADLINQMQQLQKSFQQNQ